MRPTHGTRPSHSRLRSAVFPVVPLPRALPAQADTRSPLSRVVAQRAEQAVAAYTSFQCSRRANVDVVIAADPQQATLSVRSPHHSQRAEWS